MPSLNQLEKLSDRPQEEAILYEKKSSSKRNSPCGQFDPEGRDVPRAKDVYSKKLTAEEEDKGYVLILKDQLSFFPQLGRRFQMVENGHTRRAMVESYPCSCRGPDLPHSHYFVKIRAAKSGDRVTFRKDSKAGTRYLLQVQSHPRRTI